MLVLEGSDAHPVPEAAPLHLGRLDVRLVAATAEGGRERVGLGLGLERADLELVRAGGAGRSGLAARVLGRGARHGGERVPGGRGGGPWSTFCAGSGMTGRQSVGGGGVEGMPDGTSNGTPGEGQAGRAGHPRRGGHAVG